MMDHPVIAQAYADIDNFMTTAKDIDDSDMEKAAQVICETSPIPICWRWAELGGIEFNIIH